MKFSGKELGEISFPVGGIGAGCIGISGDGRLSEWEIFNHAGKKLANGISHFAVRAESGGRVRDARILHGDLEKDLSGAFEGRQAKFHGFGWGPAVESMCGFPHFRELGFDGAFPVGEFTFGGEPEFPGRVRMTVWSPFVPGESDLASMPCAMFEIAFENTASETIDYTALGVLSHFRQTETAENAVVRNGALTSLITRNAAEPDSPEYGEVALTTDGEDVSFQEYLYRGGWSDRLEVYWHDLTTPGRFRNRARPGDPAKNPDSGLLAVHRRLAPGETGCVRFVLSWYIPNRSNTWIPPEALAREMERSGVAENRWRNYYAAHLCTSAADAARRIFGEYDAIRGRVFRFRDAIHNSTLPEASLAGAAENLAVLISPTCLRLEDGTFWGWEGVGVEAGSCPGSCQHVWNYAQALALLFPDLERSMREAHLKYGVDERGGLHFRLQLPLGIRAWSDGFRPCADGTFGEVMKMFREWKISGDGEWLKSFWPVLKRVIEFTWSPENPDAWDPEESGMLTGRMHHTLDMELFGPSGWLEGHYLGALKAAAAMAEFCGDAPFAEKCRTLFRRGRAAAEAALFNGEYYIQKIDLEDRSLPERYPDTEAYWDAEHGEVKYQIGDGCSIDSHLGQWYASLYGIGEVFDPARVRSTLDAIFRYNFRPSMRGVCNLWRVFALNDEGGTLMCVWPEGVRRPVIPLPYHSEVMTGFEWAVASHLVMCGDPERGETLARAVRERYDGVKRNPWNEIECGSNYARSMAAYAMLQAYSGFSYDMTEGVIGFAPVPDGDFRCFWALGGFWGVYERSGGEERIRVLHGGARLSGFRMKSAVSVTKNGGRIPARRNGDLLECAVSAAEGDEFSFR